MKRFLRMCTVLALALAAGVPSGAASASTPYCGITWGSLPRAASGADGVSVTNVRAGKHACYDRLVIDGASWARVAYVGQVVHDGSGAPVPLRGGAFLQIITTRSDDTHRVTYDPATPNEIVDVTGYRTFRQAAFAGSFEGQTTLGLGVRARLPFRVFVLEATGVPPRVVIDVAHLWSS
ncbi:MAG: hypothetical protein M3Y71_00395 [Actinomycetota bacterium]|nr:hypothetical protein [Actinomycetota bacterium]